MISLFNLIIRRGHVPREAAIRRLMESVGLVVVPNMARPSDDDNDDDADDEPEEESVESSVETEDESVDLPEDALLGNPAADKCR